ncbi:hypothetical protein [Merismopedia glauca]|uniref:Uncharacterized protein n=1 Tax=Merismopedia glauca CCAP 1448/3 TaxID=1296344 RepID=A0A2T1BXX4_9CYAN|nr:hypothetical protein C7B64_21235 [Merismopedia glauca CCAP 1448/3]
MRYIFNLQRSFIKIFKDYKDWVATLFFTRDRLLSMTYLCIVNMIFFEINYWGDRRPDIISFFRVLITTYLGATYVFFAVVGFFFLDNFGKKQEINTTDLRFNGFYLTIKNTAILGLFGLFIGSLFSIFTVILYGSSQGNTIANQFIITIMILTWVSSSVMSIIKYINLRIILYFNKFLPWNCTRFLDYATERVLLQKVGSGYVFIHRLLMEHFASK